MQIASQITENKVFIEDIATNMGRLTVSSDECHIFPQNKMFMSPIPAAKHKTHNTQRNKMTTD